MWFCGGFSVGFQRVSNWFPDNLQYAFLVTAICTTVTCSFTVDNYADSATYNGNPLTIITDAEYVENLGYTNLAFEKLVNFESCDDCSPGTLSIKGSDANVNLGI